MTEDSEFLVRFKPEPTTVVTAEGAADIGDDCVLALEECLRTRGRNAEDEEEEEQDEEEEEKGNATFVDTASVVKPC